MKNGQIRMKIECESCFRQGLMHGRIVQEAAVQSSAWQIKINRVAKGGTVGAHLNVGHELAGAARNDEVDVFMHVKEVIQVCKQSLSFMFWSTSATESRFNPVPIHMSGVQEHWQLDDDKVVCIAANALSAQHTKVHPKDRSRHT